MASGIKVELKWNSSGIQVELNGIMFALQWVKENNKT